jgi:hypothetical protein
MRRAAIVLLFLVILSVFIAQVYRVFLLRFESGDVYPPYSTFRADPQGMQALYESLAALPGVDAARYTGDITRVPDGSGTTLFISGVEVSPDPKPVLEAIERFVESGGRLVITFSPFAAQQTTYWDYEFVPPLEEEDPLQPDDAPVEVEEAEGETAESETEAPVTGPEEMELVDIGERWGFDYEYSRLHQNDDASLGSVWVERNDGPESLPKQLLWHSPLWFKEVDAAWKSIYTRVDQPVLLERTMGKGSIVLSSDTFLLSNEALRDEPNGALLAWIVGPNHRVIFDEAHFGIRESQGIMVLLRRYRLHLLLSVFVVLAILYLWKQSFSLVPPRDTGLEAEEQTGKDVASGLVNLLRRSIPPGQLLSVCVREWQQAFPQDKRLQGSLKHDVDLILAPDPVQPTRRHEWLERYRRLCALINERK